MSDTEAPTPKPGYYVSTLRVRRELIPVYEGEGDAKKLVAYRCLTFSVAGPKDTDKVMTDQTEFEDELIRLHLMPKRNPATWVFAKAWSGLSVDKLFFKRPVGSEPTETLLRLINN